MAADALRAARELHQRAAQADAIAREARDARDAMIRSEISSGATQRSIAEALGISAGMVARIALGGRASDRRPTDPSSAMSPT